MLISTLPGPIEHACCAKECEDHTNVLVHWHKLKRLGSTITHNSQWVVLVNMNNHFNLALTP